MTGGLLVIGATGQIGQPLMHRAGDRVTLALARDPDAVSGIPVLAFHAEDGLPVARGDWPGAAIATVPVWLLAEHAGELAARGTRRLVCFSTTSIFGKAETSNAHERAVVEKVTSAEARIRDVCEANGIVLTILRPTLIYGAGADKTITAAARFIRRFGFYPVHGAAAGKRQPVHADDLAAAALAALDCDAAAGRSYALGGGETVAYCDMIGRIFDVLGRPRRFVRVPGLPALLDIAGAVIPGSELTGDVARRMNMNLDFDDGSAARDFGYAPRAFLSGGHADPFGSRDQS